MNCWFGHLENFVEIVCETRDWIQDKEKSVLVNICFERCYLEPDLLSCRIIEFDGYWR